MADHVLNLKRPFYLAGQQVSGVMFVVGEEWTKIGLTGAYVDKDGALVISLSPEGARAIGRDLIANADKDQLKRKVLKHG